MLTDDLRAKADEIDCAVSRDKMERDSGAFGEIELMRAAADALCVADAMIWRPIEIVPKFSDRDADIVPMEYFVLLYDPDNAIEGRIQVGFWNASYDGWQTMFDNDEIKNPTHWMSLPPFPKATG